MPKATIGGECPILGGPCPVQDTGGKPGCQNADLNLGFIDKQDPEVDLILEGIFGTQPQPAKPLKYPCYRELLNKRRFS